VAGKTYFIPNSGGFPSLHSVATIGIYGIVGLIVRMDRAGLKLISMSKMKERYRTSGTVLVKALPVVIKLISNGTIALYLLLEVFLCIKPFYMGYYLKYLQS
jgi:predicted DNA repair protein MutK